jgi:pimeloyl-ACP methyl ester carboxylesterase
VLRENWFQKSRFRGRAPNHVRRNDRGARPADRRRFETSERHVTLETSSKRPALRPLRIGAPDAVITGAEVGSGPPLFLLHGLGGTCQYWQPAMELLARDLRCVALDIPGFGGSASPPGGFTLDAAADGLVAALGALGALPAVVCGHSLGGPLAARLALRHPDAVTRLVLVGPSGLAPAPTWQRRALHAVPAFTLLQRAPFPWERWLPRIAPVRRAILGLLVDNPATVGPDMAMRFFAGARAARAVPAALDASFATGLDDDAPLVSAPIAAIWGLRDRMVPPSDAEILKRVVPSAEIHYLPGCGHLPMVERPEAFTVLLRRLSVDRSG